MPRRSRTACHVASVRAARPAATAGPAVRAISTHSKTVTGKFQFTVSSWGT